MIATGACVCCGVVFRFNPFSVPSTREVCGAREPICRTCIARLNEKCRARGIEPWPVPADAYEFEDIGIRLRFERGDWRVVRNCCRTGNCVACRMAGRTTRIVQAKGVSEEWAALVARAWRKYGATAEPMPARSRKRVP